MKLFRLSGTHSRAASSYFLAEDFVSAVSSQFVEDSQGWRIDHVADPGDWLELRDGTWIVARYLPTSAAGRQFAYLARFSMFDPDSGTRCGFSSVYVFAKSKDEALELLAADLDARARGEKPIGTTLLDLEAFSRVGIFHGDWT